jgi:hypothetical protein
LCSLGLQLGGGLRNVQLLARDLQGRDAQRVPATGSMLEVQGPAVVTSIQQVGDGLHVRLFNPTAEVAEARVTLGPWARQAFHTCQGVDLEHRPIGAANEISGGLLNLRLGAKQILTVRLS